MAIPLAESIRPVGLEDVVGQKHLLDKNKPLRQIIESGHIPNMIFYGSSGIGKTTVARIIANQTKMRLHKLNGTSTSTADIKSIVAEVDTIAGCNGILLYLDEIQYLNKKQQQSLLEHIENGDITLIASTTENPYFYIYNAILSRCTVFEFKSIQEDEAIKAVERGFTHLTTMYGEEVVVNELAKKHIANSCGGDIRKAMNATELTYLSACKNQDGVKEITHELAVELTQKSGMQYDKDGESHYDILSALQKSIRGSDENGALHYLARLLEAGDLISACRRLMIIACEDIALAYPQAMTIVKSCCDIATQVGLPEAKYPLSSAVVLLATAPKSNSACVAINMALEDVRNGYGKNIPRCLQNEHYDGDDIEVKGQFYKYPHDYPNHYVEQQYLPDDLLGRVYYNYGENKLEQASYNYQTKIKNNSSD